MTAAEPQTIDELKLENGAYVWEVANLKAERDGLIALLRAAQPIVCSMDCLSVNKGDGPWVHTILCESISKAMWSES